MTPELITYYVLGALAIILVSALVFVFWKSEKKMSERWMIGLGVFVGLSLPVQQILKYNAMSMYADFAHWLGILESIRTTGYPDALNQEFLVSGTLNYLSVHFVPYIYAIAVPYLAVPRPETLIALNAILMLSAAVPLYLLAKKMHGEKWFGLLAATCLMLYPTFQYITLYEFEMLRFSIPILFWMLYFWESKRIKSFFLLAILACFLREEVGLTIAMFGVYVFLFEKSRKIGASVFLLGLGSFFAVTEFLMPLFRAGDYVHVAAGTFAQFGNTPLEVLQGIASRPMEALSVIVDLQKIANIGMLLLPLLGVSLFAAKALVPAAANIGIGLISDSYAHSSYLLYYVAPTVPFAFYAFIQGWPRLVQIVQSRFASITEVRLARGFFAGVVSASIIFGATPIALQFWFQDVRPAPFRTQNFHYSTYLPEDRHGEVDTIVAQIPDEAIVSAQQFLHPRLFQKRGAMAFPDLYSRDGAYRAEYVLLDLANNGLGDDSPAYVSLEEMRIVTQDSGWELIHSGNNGYLLYVRVQ